MKLKGFSNRLYNIFFHTHTVSGIVISFLLYVIFFAGAFALFKDEFYKWENKEARIPHTREIDFEYALKQVEKERPDFTLEGYNYFALPSEADPLLQIAGYTLKPDSSQEYTCLIYDPVNKKLLDGDRYGNTTVGETLYRLHFFDQLPYAGRWIAGFTAFFFLFAIITGVLVHWRNILTNFYAFSLKGSLKQFWTKAHTVFGMIGLPFQLMYAVTGAYYLLSVLILLPIVMIFYNGDQAKIYEMLIPHEQIKLSDSAANANNYYKVSQAIQKIEKDYPGNVVEYFQIDHINKEDALLNAYTFDQSTFSGDGTVSVYLKDHKTAVEVMPGSKPYYLSVLNGIKQLHYARFGGIILKSIYFILALFTCFVIISGVLLWKEARNKKNYTDKQKRFHHRTTMVYLAICLSLFPATAIIFSAQQVFFGDDGMVKTVFFISWLILALMGLFSRSESRMTSLYLALGAVFSLLVPVFNGYFTGDWLFENLGPEYAEVAATDVFWLVVGAACATLLVGKGMRKKLG